MLTPFPETVLQTETAIRVGLLVRAAHYELAVSPRKTGADIAASRNGTVWATFHIDAVPKRPLFLRVGATVWGGARVLLDEDLSWQAVPDAALDAFVKDRLALACRRGQEQDPAHCRNCADPSHRAPP